MNAMEPASLELTQDAVPSGPGPALAALGIGCWSGTVTEDTRHDAVPLRAACLRAADAVSLALGWARVTEGAMAVSLAEDEILQAGQVLREAQARRLPLLLLASVYVPGVALAGMSCKSATCGAGLETRLEGALRIAHTSPLGPVLVDPDDAPGPAPVSGATSPTAPPPRPASAAEEDLEELLEIIAEARAPVLLIGEVSRDTGDWARRVELAEALGLPVLTSAVLPAAFPTAHPLHAQPPSGTAPGRAERTLIARADAVVALGWPDLAVWLEARDHTGRVVHVTCEEDETLPPGLVLDIRADPDRATAQLLEMLSAAGHDPDHPLWGVPAGPALPPAHWTLRETPVDRGGELTIAEIALAVSDFTAGRSTTLARVPADWPGEACWFEHPLDGLGCGGSGAVAEITGAALALRHSDRLVIGVLEDAEFLRDVPALWTAMRLDLPLMLVVANTGRHAHRAPGLSHAPALTVLAEAQGMEAEGPVSTAGPLAEALERAAGVALTGGACLIEVAARRG